MIRGVIFDLGNTLMYFDGAWEEVTRRGLEALTQELGARGLNLSESFAQDFIETRRAGRERSVRTNVEYTATQALRDTLKRQGCIQVPDKVITHGLELYFAPEEERWITYEDAVETLKQLRAQGLRVGAISNATDGAFIEYITRNGGVQPFLDPIISSSEMPWRKPDPRIFQHVLDAWQLPADQVVMVGDGPRVDVLGAHRAGMPAILLEERWIESPHLSAEVPDPELLEPELTLRDLRAIIPALERLNNKSG